MPEHLYKTYRIGLLFNPGDGAWYPEALVLSDSVTGSIGTPVYDKQAYFMKDKAHVQALKLAKRWVDKQQC